MEENIMSPVRGRLIIFIKAKGLTNAEFCRIAGIRSNFINTVTNVIRPDKLLPIAKAFPELNIMWLLTGDGLMFNPGYEFADHIEVKAAPAQPQPTAEPQPTADIAYLQLQLKSAQKEIDSLNALIAQHAKTNDILQSTNAKLEEDKAELKQRVAKLEAKLDEKDIQIKSMAATGGSLNSRSAQTQASRSAQTQASMSH